MEDNGKSVRTSLPSKTNFAFKEGEVLSYRVHYGFIDAGVAIIEVKPEIEEIGGRKVYHVVGNGYSKGTFDFFFKVRDRYESYIDKDALLPWLFIRRVDEGGFKFSQNYFFNHYKKEVKTEDNQVYSIPDEVHDMISAFYAARNIDFSNAKKGDVFTVMSFVDKELWPLKMKYLGKDEIKTDIGKFKCLKFCPIVQRGRIFKKEEDLLVWITDDKNHIPLRAQAKILVGSIKMDITDIKNNANPLSKIE
ncbi:MAG: DUF3108 domain-containing protein [Bacteroidia bacterium]